MRIRLHKSRFTASSLIAVAVFVSAVAVAAPQVLNVLQHGQEPGQSNSNLPGQDGSPGQSQDQDHGKSCDAHRTNNNNNPDGQTNGNGEAADCAYTVTFNGNGSTGGSTAAQTSYTSTALTANGFTRGGYTFSGWNTAANNSGTSYANNASYAFTAALTLYAQWTAGTPASHTVTFNGNGSDGGLTAAQSANTSTALTANGFSRTGYTFSAWNTVALGGGTSYANNASYGFTAALTLYAQWSANASPSSSASSTTAASPKASPLVVVKVITPKMTKMTTTYNNRRQGTEYTVEPSTALCKVRYNGSTAMPTHAGSYDVIISCKDGKVVGTTTGTFVIKMAQPVLTWSDPNAITTSNALTVKELNAKSNVVGTYEYSPALGTKLPEGTQDLNVTLIPRDGRNYLTATMSVKILVTKVVAKPAPIFKPIKVPFTLSSAGLTSTTRAMIKKIFLNKNINSVTVYGYVQPSKNKAADMKLSMQRAQTVAKQLKGISPTLKITIKAMGATINSACNAEKNKCVIVK